MKKLIKYSAIITIALTAIGVAVRANVKLNRLESIDKKLGKKTIIKSRL